MPFKIDQTICHYICFLTMAKVYKDIFNAQNEIWQICHDNKNQYCHVKKTQKVEKFMCKEHTNLTRQ